MHRDSFSKVLHYFVTVAREPFVCDGTTYTPKPLVISPMIFRGYTCPPGCAGCCPKFSLVYLPEDIEPHPYPLDKKTVVFNGKNVLLFEDFQKDNPSFKCKNVNWETGRCGIHGKHPFTCDFELLRVLEFKDHFMLTQKLYGRGWNMSRVDGGRGALCEMTPHDKENHLDLIRRMKRLQTWVKYFGLNTHLLSIMQWLESGPHSTPLKLGFDNDEGEGLFEWQNT